MGNALESPSSSSIFAVSPSSPSLQITSAEATSVKQRGSSQGSSPSLSSSSSTSSLLRGSSSSLASTSFATLANFEDESTLPRHLPSASLPRLPSASSRGFAFSSGDKDKPAESNRARQASRAFPSFWSKAESQASRLWQFDSDRRERAKSNTLWTHELQLLVGHTDFVRSAARLDDERLVTASDDGTICVWNWRLGGLIGQLKGHSRTVTSLLWITRLGVLVSGSSDKSIRLWDMATLVEIATQTRPSHAGGITCLREMDALVSLRHWNLENDSVFCSGGNDSVLRVWRVQRGSAAAASGGGGGGGGKGKSAVNITLVSEIQRQEEDDANLNGMLFILSDIDQQGLLLTASNSPVIMVYDVAALHVQLALKGHQETVLSLAAINTALFASGSVDGQVILWHVRTLSALKSIDNVYDDGLALSTQHKLFPWPVRQITRLGPTHFAASFGHGLKIFNLEGELVVERHDESDSMIVHLASIYDDTILATASIDATVKLWRVNFAARSITLFSELVVHTDAVNHILPLDSSTFCSCSSDGLVALFKAPRAIAITRNTLALANLLHHSPSPGSV